MTRTLALLVAAALGVSACGSHAHSAATVANPLVISSVAPTAGGVAGGPGGEAGAAAAAGSSDVTSGTGCPLTAAQVTGVMKTTYQAPTSAHGICSYAGGDGNALTIAVTSDSSAAAFATALATVKTDQGTQTATDLDVGEHAVGVGLEILVISGSHLIDIRNADSPGFGKWPKSSALAELVIAGLH